MDFHRHMTSSISFEQLLLEFQSLKQSIECQQGTIDALQATVIAQQATILRLSLSNDLTLPIVAAIFKSHIVKATACLIFWSLRHCLNSYVPPETVTLLDALVEVMVDLRKPRSDAEQHAIFLIRPGPHLQDDMEILEDARSLRSGGYTPMHLKGRTPGNTIGDLDKKTLARLLNEVSLDLGSFTI